MFGCVLYRQAADSVWSLQNSPGGTRHHVVDGSNAHTSPSPEGLSYGRKKARVGPGNSMRDTRFYSRLDFNQNL